MFSTSTSVGPNDLHSRYLIVDESDRGTVLFRLQDLTAARTEKIGQVQGAIARNEYDLDELLDHAIESLADDVFGN